MFFRKHVVGGADRPEGSEATERPVSQSAGHPPVPSPAGPSAASPSAAARGGATEESLGLVLDALGGVLTALSRFPLDLPELGLTAGARELGPWHRHATLGYPLDGGAGTVGVQARDWDGVVRAVTDLRRTEQQQVAASVTELREALWTCVEKVHKVVQLDQAADAATEQQMARAKAALTRMQTGSIKQEVLGAVLAIESTMQTRREKQQEQYVSLATQLEKLGRQLEEARRESTTDALTGLGNRKRFDLMAPRALQLYSLSRQPVVLLMADMDKLKLVNDLYGHRAGDIAIQNLGKALSRTFLRQSDVLCRLGGDEFAVILHNTDWRTAQTLAGRLQEQLAQMPAPHPNMEFSVGASVGVAQLEPADDVESWVARADRALYRAKQNGRERVCVADLVTEHPAA